MRYLATLSLCLAGLISFTGCTTMDPQMVAARAAMNEAIPHEAPGNYFIGRRFYKNEFKMWGWVRKPGQLWNQSQLVMFNEQRKLAPDREQGKIGADNNYEYRLEGYFSGETVYEPASNRFYPEFVLTGYELRSISPPTIFKDPKTMKPETLLLGPVM
ncbi:MAG: hypothetical protein ABI615_05310 [Chthoniobacterales bacterium]